MNLSKIVIHEIIKEQKSIEAESFLSNEILPTDVKTIRLAITLNNAFSKDDVVYAIFRQNNNEFHFRFNEYQESLSAEDFLAFTRDMTEELESLLEDKFMSKGGFLVFSEYEVNNVNFFGIFLIRDEEGILFQKNEDDHTFAVNLTKYLNTNKLAMGCRININKLEDQDSNHLSLIKGGQADISEYFYDWIGVENKKSNKEYTDRLFSIVSNIEVPINPDTGAPYGLNEVREIAFNNIKASAGKVVNLRQLSISLYGDEDTILDYVNEHNIEIDTEFKYDSRALAKFKRIDANRDGIRLAFSRGDLNQKVSLSEDDPTVIILRSRHLADDIRNKLEIQ